MGYHNFSQRLLRMRFKITKGIKKFKEKKKTVIIIVVVVIIVTTPNTCISEKQKITNVNSAHPMKLLHSATVYTV